MLFSNDSVTELADGAVVLHGVAEAVGAELVKLIDEVVRVSPLRTVMTPMGKPMSVEMTNCGAAGWVSDRSGYRYETIDPLTDRPWPAMPATFRKFANTTANRAGYQAFDPDVCLVNRYAVGSKMGLHQDRDERDFSQPIVSVSLGLPITFKFGGSQRTDRTTSVKLQHGDVVVFGGASRLAFHGVGTLRRGHHELTGGYRFNLTFRSL